MGYLGKGIKVNTNKEIEFYQKTKEIAIASRRLDSETIHLISDALEIEFKSKFNKRFRKMEFLRTAGLV